MLFARMNAIPPGGFNAIFRMRKSKS